MAPAQPSPVVKPGHVAFLTLWGPRWVCAAESPRVEQRRWLLQCAAEVWTKFSASFLHLWDQQHRHNSGSSSGGPGDAFPESLFGRAAAAGTASLQVGFAQLRS